MGKTTEIDTQPGYTANARRCKCVHTSRGSGTLSQTNRCPPPPGMWAMEEELDSLSQPSYRQWTGANPKSKPNFRSNCLKNTEQSVLHFFGEQKICKIYTFSVSSVLSPFFLCVFLRCVAFPPYFSAGCKVKTLSWPGAHVHAATHPPIHAWRHSPIPQG